MQMLMKISKLIVTHPLLWRIVGFVSSIVAFTCFALSPSFHDLFGRWNLFKIAIYSVASLILTTLMLIIKRCRKITRSVLVKTIVGSLVMMLTSLYSIWQDLNSEKEDDENGSRGRILNMCSFGAFGLMSLSWSRQLQLGFEVGISNFVFGSFLVLLIKMDFILIPLASLFCYMFIYFRYFSDHQREMRGRVDSSDTVLPNDIESGNQSVDLQRMSNAESLKESIYVIETRAESAEAQVSQLTETTLELTEELNFLKGSASTAEIKVGSLEKQLRESEIQLQNAKASSEASQEQQNMLYTAIWDMELLIEELKSKVSEAESKTEGAEEQRFELSETNEELNKELDLQRARPKTLETVLYQANDSKMKRRRTMTQGVTRDRNHSARRPRGL